MLKITKILISFLLNSVDRRFIKKMLRPVLSQEPLAVRKHCSGRYDVKRANLPKIVFFCKFLDPPIK